jgi:Mrp family chromosome partitioning ATPase
MRLIKRRLLTAIDTQVAAGKEQARVVLVASGRPGEGKTFTALNLALSIAGEPERSVLLVDGDSAKPELMTRLELEEDLPGFLDSLADPQLDPETLVLDTDVERLSLLPAGRKVRNIPELLASARTDEVLARLREANPRRIIVLDSSPALAASSAAVLAGLSGQTLVVVKADETSESDLKETLDLLSVCDHLSLVLNSTAFQVGSRRFGKYEEYR